MNHDKVNKLSIVIPCYNEEKTLSSCVENVLAIAHERLTLEIIIVDDGSTDNSPAIVTELAQRYEVVEATSLESNQGKGAALRAGFQKATGNFVAVQDADLEHDPKDRFKVIGSGLSPSGLSSTLCRGGLKNLVGNQLVKPN